jgi:hypothetical protein
MLTGELTAAWRHEVAAGLIVCIIAFTSGSVAAHPVSQGAIEIQIKADVIRLRATVSPEEIIIANTVPSTRFARAVQTHGTYLLAHIEVSADGHPLPGQVVTVPPESPSEALETSTYVRPTYDMVYPLRGLHPRLVHIQENILREIEFAPGNPWEAMFIVTVDHKVESGGPGMLLSFRQPVDIHCSWNGNTVSSTDPTLSWELLSFVSLGIMHILTGYDHLLFIAALVLAIRGFRDLITVVSAFTLAHTITLTLAALDIFRLSDTLVEPMIAASIVAIAGQNVFWPRHSHGVSRTAVAFLFGLFHGLGFAGGLLDAMSSMQGASAAATIVAFSVGVEIGQQVVVIPVFGALGLLRKQTANALIPISLVQRCGSMAICMAGSVYFEIALRS